RPRTYVSFRIAVAIEAPLHLQRVLLPHQRHAVDLSVTRRAADSLIDVDAVVEIDEVGQVVHARPFDRSAGAEALSHRLEERAVREELRVAVHARLGRRNARERRLLDRRVAVAAVDAVARDVPLVAELDRLLARGARLRHPRRSIHFVEESEERCDEEDTAEDADPRNRIRAAMKDL